MSRIGKKTVSIPRAVKLEQKGQTIKVLGPLGQQQIACPRNIKVKIDDSNGKILVENTEPQDRQCKQLHGTVRALIANMVTGVSKGFVKKMEIYGTGYSVREKGGKLAISVGFSKPVERSIPQGIKVNIEADTARGDDVPARFTLSGIDKCLVGQFAADIRKIRPPEPYKGKGIRYAGEYVRRKVGKAFTSGTTTM